LGRKSPLGTELDSAWSLLLTLVHKIFFPQASATLFIHWLVMMYYIALVDNLFYLHNCSVNPQIKQQTWLFTGRFQLLKAGDTRSSYPEFQIVFAKTNTNATVVNSTSFYDEK
jgi:hypothetical protein